jgi:hypothetical protein
MKKRGSDATLQDGLEIVIRHWPHAPAHIKRVCVELLSNCRPESNGIRFPTPPGTTCGDIEIVLLSAEEARITVGVVSHCYTFRELGLAGRRQKNKPSAEWRVLRTYAENPEPDAYCKLPFRRSLKVEVSKFRRWLQGFFGLPDDPLQAIRDPKMVAPIQNSSRVSLGRRNETKFQIPPPRPINFSTEV